MLGVLQGHLSYVHSKLRGVQRQVAPLHLSACASHTASQPVPLSLPLTLPLSMCLSHCLSALALYLFVLISVQVRRVTAEVAESTGNLSNWGAFQDGATAQLSSPNSFVASLASHQTNLAHATRLTSHATRLTSLLPPD